MTLTKADEYKLLHLLLDMGEMMMCSGGEVRRVENTLSLMGKAYGATETNVMVITASIIVTMKFGDGNLITESRRVESPGSNKLWRLEGLNALSRRCCENPLSIEELEREIKNCKQPTNLWKFYLGSALAAGAFGVFFGGNILDGIIAALFALVVCLFQRKLSNIFPNNIIFNIVCSFVVGVLICFITKLIPSSHTDMVMVGVIMLLIPGIAFTNSMRDILVGDTISGIMRLIESLLWAAGLAVGFMLSILLVGSTTTTNLKEAEEIIQLITGMLGSLGFALLFGLKKQYLIAAALGGLLNWGLYLAGMYMFNAVFFAGLLASATSALYSEIIARIKKAPATLFFITSVIPLIPGRALYYTCSSAVLRDWADVKTYGNVTLQYALSIAAGTCIIWAITLTIENIKKNKKTN